MNQAPRTAKPTRRAAHVLIAAAATLAISACTQPPATEEPITLTYWSWAPGIENVIAIWNEANPDVQVEVNTSTGGAEIVAKLQAAHQAGDLPDLSNTTYENLPNLITSDIASDITAIMGDRKDLTSPPAWNMTTFDGANYAVPQGTAPMFLFYRHDIFEEFDITPPTTWEEYAQAARDLRQAAPEKYLGTFSTNDGQLFAGLAQQAGSQWWSVDEGTWTVAIDDDPGAQVADFWEELIREDSIATFNSYTPEWQAALADGTVASLIGAVWTPPILANNAPDTLGLWTAIPLPQWGQGTVQSGVLGGSGTIVTTGSKHPEAAQEFALWLNSSDEAIRAYIEHASIWPAALSGRELPELSTTPELLGDQADFYSLASEIDEYTVDVTWGPNVAFTYDAFSNAFGDAVNSTTSFNDALADVHSRTQDDLVRGGFTINK